MRLPQKIPAEKISCKRSIMNKGETAGRWAQILLFMVLFAVWFNVVCITGWHIKEWFL